MRPTWLNSQLMPSTQTHRLHTGGTLLALAVVPQNHHGPTLLQSYGTLGLVAKWPQNEILFDGPMLVRPLHILGMSVCV